MLRASAAHFPGVGWIVGAAAGGAYAALALALPATPLTTLVAAVGCTIATVLLTGAFHEDGLADLADGLGGSSSRDRALEIMKDSRIGAFGAIALVLALLAKVSLLAVLGANGPMPVVAALFAAHVVSRFAPLLLIRGLAYVGDTAGSKSKPLADRISGLSVWIGLAWCVVPVALAGLALGPVVLACMVGAGGLGAGWMARLLHRRLQGFTGDGLGAAQQVCELACYLGTALAIGSR
jgi:adenosylcobinamide-GDP ribazoletransferase